PPLRQLILGRWGWWNLWLIAGPIALAVPSDLDSIANAGRIDAPAAFVMSTGDTIVPYPYQQKVHAAYAGMKRAVTLDADHNTPFTREDQRRLREAMTWLFEQATDRRPGNER